MRTSRRSKDAYNSIKEMVLTGRLKPGNRLLDRDLAGELGVSRTPVREALSRLAQDGLLENGRGIGYYVADLDAKQVADLYALREVLEAHAARLAAERITAQDIKELVGVLATLDHLIADPSKRGEEIRIGLKIHEIIARASGDVFLYETMARLLNRMHLFIWMDTLHEDAERAELTRREHRDLVGFIHSGKAEQAEQLIRTHIRTGKEGILRVLAARDAFYTPSESVHSEASARQPESSRARWHARSK
jgi:DNA-binding GntR family transcriptional regulator